MGLPHEHRVCTRCSGAAREQAHLSRWCLASQGNGKETCAHAAPEHRAEETGVRAPCLRRGNLAGDGGLAGAVESGEEGALAVNAILGLLVVQGLDEPNSPLIIGTDL